MCEIRRGRGGALGKGKRDVPLYRKKRGGYTNAYVYDL